MKELRFSEAADAFGRSIDNGNPLPQDRMLKLRALVLAGQSDDGLRWAENGPKDHLSAEMIAWWARAAFNVGDIERARGLLRKLHTPHGYDGPPWVVPLAKQVSTPPTE